MENIRECRELEHALFSEYYSSNGSSSVSRQIMEEMEENSVLVNEESEAERYRDLDVAVEEDGDIEMHELVTFNNHKESEQEDLDDFEAVEDDEPLVTHHSHCLQARQQHQQSNELSQDAMDQSSQQRSQTPPLPESEREDPWHFANIEH